MHSTLVLLLIALSKNLCENKIYQKGGQLLIIIELEKCIMLGSSSSLLY